MPLPKDKASFLNFAKLGKQLRLLHLLELAPDPELANFPEPGHNIISDKFNNNSFELADDGKTGKVWIDDKQYFDNVPKLCWEFQIGGYQPAQKWLKDRKNKILNHNKLEHYQKIITALLKTHQLMQELNKLPFE